MSMLHAVGPSQGSQGALERCAADNRNITHLLNFDQPPKAWTDTVSTKPKAVGVWVSCATLLRAVSTRSWSAALHSGSAARLGAHGGGAAAAAAGGRLPRQTRHPPHPLCAAAAMADAEMTDFSAAQKLLESTNLTELCKKVRKQRREGASSTAFFPGAQVPSHYCFWTCATLPALLTAACAAVGTPQPCTGPEDCAAGAQHDDRGRAQDAGQAQHPVGTHGAWLCPRAEGHQLHYPPGSRCMRWGTPMVRARTCKRAPAAPAGSCTGALEACGGCTRHCSCLVWREDRQSDAATWPHLLSLACFPQAGDVPRH